MGNTIYVHKNADEAVAYIFENGETVYFTGCQVHYERAKFKDSSFTKPFSDNGFYFFFDDEEFEPDIYSVPFITILGHDNEGGYFCVLDDNISFSEDFDLHYISKDREVFKVEEKTSDILKGSFNWRENLKKVSDVKLFSSREEAEKEFKIYDSKDLEP